MHPGPPANGGHREVDLTPNRVEDAIELDGLGAGAQPAAPSASATDTPLAPASHPAEPDALRLQSFPERDPAQLVQQRAPLLRQIEQRRARLPVAPPSSVRADLRYARWLYPLLGLLALAVVGYGYCRYRVHEQQHLFFRGNQPLRDLVLRSRARPDSDDVRRIVIGLAHEAGLKLAPTDVEVIVEPLDSARHADQLEPEELTRAQAFGASWIVGHRTRAIARFGVVAQAFTLERFFYLHDFAAPPTATPRTAGMTQSTGESP